MYTWERHCTLRSQNVHTEKDLYTYMGPQLYTPPTNCTCMEVHVCNHRLLFSACNNLPWVKRDMVAQSIELALFVAITTIPARLPHVIPTILSFAAQLRPPQMILLSAPEHFTRFPGVTANLSIVPAQLAKHGSVAAKHALNILKTVICERDDGPGTKLLCVLPHLYALARAQAHTARPS